MGCILTPGHAHDMLIEQGIVAYQEVWFCIHNLTTDNLAKSTDSVSETLTPNSSDMFGQCQKFSATVNRTSEASTLASPVTRAEVFLNPVN
jgi:hypothetical protein